MEPRPASTPTPRPDAQLEPRQRWRLTVRRASDAPPLSQRDLSDAWDAAVLESGLPVFVGDPAKPKTRVVFGAPLTVGMAADGELLEIVLTDRLPAWQVRDALSPRIPEGWSLVDLADVWLGGPALVGRVVAADYRVAIAGSPEPDVQAVEVAVQALLDSPTIPRERLKGGGSVAYDLRPLLADLRVVDAGPPVAIGIRTRFHAELGTGRPEEVVLALADRLGVELSIASIRRERLVLADEPDPASSSRPR